jgi:hypothetical protein
MEALGSIGERAKNSSQSDKSFAQQLSSTMNGGRSEAETLARAGDHSSRQGGRFYAGRQNNAAAAGEASTRVPTPLTAGVPPGTSTGKGPSTVPAPLTGGISTTPPATTRPSDIPTMLGMGPVAGTAPVQVPTSTAPTSSVQMTEGDAYWAQQPAAVQALRYMPQGPEKDALALKLSNQGYSIDTQIMVMGWDPQMTMAAREGFGYTWVPSYGQPAITVQPGISDPYMSSNYNPASPPAGSIPVSLAFALGTIQNPLVHMPDTIS